LIGAWLEQCAKKQTDQSVLARSAEAFEDGQDDGGSTEMRPGKSSQRNLWDRKDFVWPLEATKEELEEYRKKGNR